MATSTAKDTVRDRVRYRRQWVTEHLPRIPGIPYVFILPFYVLFVVFLAFPVLYTLYLSFFEFQTVSSTTLFTLNIGGFSYELQSLSTLEYVGLDNYSRLLGDSRFHKALYNTFFILVVQVPIMVVTALVFAVTLDSSLLKLRNWFRTIIALPVAANFVAYSTIFLLLFNEQFGLINYVLTRLGLDAIPWLTNGFWARMTIVSAIGWRWTGYNMLILFAGLQSIPQHLYEAAEVDGANRWHKFRYVTLPQLRPVLLFVVVTSTIGTFKIFSEPFVITGGGPGNQSITIVYYLYNQAFQQFNIGYASAVAYVLVLIVSVLSFIQLRLGGDDE
jgi:multiple sugar transport system permease protein/lactose/L-arabinose transport system permease protein